MKAAIVKVGNSHGIRIPKRILEQCAFGREVVLSVEDGRLIVAADRRPREGWAEDAALCAASGDDALLLGDFPNAFDEKEWTW